MLRGQYSSNSLVVLAQRQGEGHGTRMHRSGSRMPIGADDDILQGEKSVSDSARFPGNGTERTARIAGDTIAAKSTTRV